MKNLYIMLAFAALAMLLSGCPSTGDGEGGTTATSTSPDHATDVADAAAEEEISHPLLDAELKLTPVEWEVNGCMLGDAYDDYMLLQAEDANSNAMWIKDGVLGMLNIFNTQEDPMPAESTVYQNGQLISLMRTEEMDHDAFAVELADAMTAYGDYSDEPPEWALDTALFEDGYEPEEGIEMSFWGDEDARAMMLYGYDTENSVAARMIVYVDHHAEVVDATVADFQAKMQEEMQAQMEAMAAEQAAAAAAAEGEEGGETPFEIVGEGGEDAGEAVEGETGDDMETETGDGEAETE